MFKRVGIGLFGGTFDPVHLGHMHLAEQVYDAPSLASVHFIPAAQPLLKKHPMASQEERLQMLKSAIEPYPHYQLDDREIKRGGRSYMIDTLESIRVAYPNEPLLLMIGIDQFQKLDQWKSWTRLTEHAHLVVTSRKGIDATPLSSDIKTFLLSHQTDKVQDLKGQISGKILLLSIDTLPISSTLIRENIRKGTSVQPLVPEPVWAYINKRGIY